MSDFATYLTGLVRERLRRMPAFAGITRDTFDNEILADLESTIRRDRDDWVAEEAHAAREEIRADIELEMEMAAEEAKKAKKKNKKGAAT